MAYSHTQVKLRGFHFEAFMLTVYLAAGITKADEGKALTWDTSGPNKMKLAGDGDAIIARLEIVEDRKVEGTLVGTAAFRFANQLPIAANANVFAGNYAIGGGGGAVKAATGANTHYENYVAEVESGYATVVRT